MTYHDILAEDIHPCQRLHRGFWYSNCSWNIPMTGKHLKVVYLVHIVWYSKVWNMFDKLSLCRHVVDLEPWQVALIKCCCHRDGKKSLTPTASRSIRSRNVIRHTSKVAGVDFPQNISPTSSMNGNNVEFEMIYFVFCSLNGGLVAAQNHRLPLKFTADLDLDHAPPHS